MLNLRPMFSVLLRQLYLWRSSPTRVLPMFVWTSADVILWGFMSVYLARTGLSRKIVPELLTAVICWNFLIRSVHGVTTAFLEDVWSRNFANVFGSPMTVVEYLGGLVISSLLTSTVALVVMSGVARLAFGLSLHGHGAELALVLVPLLGFGIALGIVGSAIVLALGPAAEWLVWPLPTMLAPLVGIYYPLETLPTWLRTLARAFAPTHVFEALRHLITRGQFDWSAMRAASGLSLLSLIVACWMFAMVHRRTLRSGALARYTAESMS